MLPDLGKYAEAVLSAYAVSIVLLIGLILMSMLKGRRVRKQMQKIEMRGDVNG